MSIYCGLVWAFPNFFFLFFFSLSTQTLLWATLTEMLQRGDKALGKAPALLPRAHE